MSDLHDLLDRAAPADGYEPDFDGLAATGVRRRRTKRAGTAVAAVVLAVGAAAIATDLATPGPAPVIGQQPADSRSWIPVEHGPRVARDEPTMVADGDRVLVWGGHASMEDVDTVAADGTVHGSVRMMDGAIFDATDGSWTHLGEAFAAPRWAPIVRYAKDRAVVFGGYPGERVGDGVISSNGDHPWLMDGALYDVATRTWTAIPAAPLERREQAVVLWDGEELLVWGGHLWGGDGPEREARNFVDGAIWSEDDGWRPMADLTEVTGDAFVRAWVGADERRLAVVGGADAGSVSEVERWTAVGAVYDRRQDRWETVELGAPVEKVQVSEHLAGRGLLVQELVGDRLLVVGGEAATGPSRTGAWVDIVTGEVAPIAEAPDGAAWVHTTETSAYATGDRRGDPLWIYDVDADAWVELRDVPEPQDRVLHIGEPSVLTGPAVDWLTDGAWRPVSLADREGTIHAPAIHDDGRVRFWYSTAVLDSGVLLWGGMEGTLDAEGTYHGDGVGARGGWFLPTR